jgi:putative DNA primase/helicase
MPLCLVEAWENPAVNDADSARSLLQAFAAFFRDAGAGKADAKRILWDWSERMIIRPAQDTISQLVEDAYADGSRLSCDMLRVAAGQYCEERLCDYPRGGRPARAWRSGGKPLVADDVTSVSAGKDGAKQVAFDPSKAADAVIKSLHLKTTSDDKTIWCYRNGIYEPYGEEAIDYILDALCGNLYTIHQSKEVMKKIRARTLCVPNIFDQKLNLFGVENGVLDLETGEFSPHSPDFLISLKSPIKYDPKAECPRFINFLWESLGSIDDILTVLDCFVAMATMATWEYFVAMIGPGSNGKSVLESAISAFFGPDQVTEVELSELNANQFIRGAIRRKRALINSEVQGTKMESRWIKMISGGTMIDSDLKNRDRIHFRPSCLQIFDSNSPPQFWDNTFGFQRRLIKLDFRFSFVDDPSSEKDWEKKRDPQLLQKITSESELSGLLNLIVMRSRDIVRSRTIHRRAAGAKLTEEYDRQSHSVSSFFSECYSIQEEDTWKLFTAFDDIREKYERYCRAINAAPESDRAVAYYLKKTLGRGSERPYVEGVRKRGYYGLSFDKTAFDTIISNYDILRTDSFSIGQNGTDDRTEKTAARDTRTDKTQKYPVEILEKIYTYIDNRSENAVPSVHTSHDIENAVPNMSQNQSHFAPDGRNLDEEGDWEDCDLCGLPLPPSWQHEGGNSIYCQNCLENVINRRK